MNPYDALFLFLLLGVVASLMLAITSLLYRRIPSRVPPPHSEWCGGSISEIDVARAGSYLGIDHTLPWLLKRVYLRCDRCGSIVEVDVESGKIVCTHWSRPPCP